MRVTTTLHHELGQIVESCHSDSTRQRRSRRRGPVLWSLRVPSCACSHSFSYFRDSDLTTAYGERRSEFIEQYAARKRSGWSLKNPKSHCVKSRPANVGSLGSAFMWEAWSMLCSMRSWLSRLVFDQGSQVVAYVQNYLSIRIKEWSASKPRIAIRNSSPLFKPRKGYK